MLKMMPNNHMAKYKYKRAGLNDASYKRQKQTKAELMKALKDIQLREQDSQTKTGANFDFIKKVLKGNEDWLEP